MLVIGTGQSVGIAVLPMLGRELALDQLVVTLPFSGTEWAIKELAITLMSASSALVLFLSAPFWGRFSDQHGRRRTMINGLVGYGLITLVFCLLATLGLEGLLYGMLLLVLLAVTRAASVFMLSAVQPSASAWVIDNTPIQHRMRDMSRLSAAVQLGAMLGPGLAWFAAISFLSPFYLQVTLMLLAAVLVRRLLPEPVVVHGRRNKPAPLRYRDPRISAMVLMQAMIFTLLAMVQQTLAFYFQDRLGLSRVEATQFFSLAIMFSAIATLVVQLGFVQYLKGSPLRLLRTGLPIALVAFLLLALGQSTTVFYVALGLLGTGMGLCGPGIGVTATYAVEANEQGGLAGLMTAAAGLGFVIGPLLGGFVYRFDISLPMWTAAALLLPLIVIAFRLRDPHQY